MFWKTWTQHQTDPLPTEFLLNIYEQQTTLAQADFTNYEKVWRHQDYAFLLRNPHKTVMSNKLRWFLQIIRDIKNYEEIRIMPFYYEILIKRLWAMNCQWLGPISSGWKNSGYVKTKPHITTDIYLPPYETRHRMAFGDCSRAEEIQDLHWVGPHLL